MAGWHDKDLEAAFAENTASSLGPASTQGVSKSKRGTLASLPASCICLGSPESPRTPGTAGLVDEHLEVKGGTPGKGSSVVIAE